MAMRIFVTGGTIDGLDYSSGQHAPKRRASRVPEILRNARVIRDYRVSVLMLKDSKFITEKDRGLIAESCRSCEEKRILITHGSMTMAATAKFLAKKRLGKTIVLFGSITPMTKRRSDSHFNTGFAFAAVQFLPPGVYIAMNGRVFPANNVRKNLGTQYFEEEK